MDRQQLYGYTIEKGVLYPTLKLLYEDIGLAGKEFAAGADLYPVNTRDEGRRYCRRSTADPDRCLTANA